MVIIDAESTDYFAEFTVLKTKNPNLKTLIAIGGEGEGSKKFSSLVEDPSGRRTFIKSAIKFLREVCLITYQHEGVFYMCERFWATGVTKSEFIGPDYVALV